MCLKGRQSSRTVFQLFGQCWEGILALLFTFLVLVLLFCTLASARNTELGVAGSHNKSMTSEEWTSFVAAYSNPFLSRQKLLKVYTQLRRFSGKSFRVYPFQTNLIGVAKPGGKIMIDISIVGKPVEILAFWLAHEWAHHDLGHAINRFATPRMTINALLRRRRFPTASEDEADVWAARFMALNHYAISGVLEDLCRLRGDRPDKVHSSWEQRALNVAATYNRITGQAVQPSCLSQAMLKQRFAVGGNNNPICGTCWRPVMRRTLGVILYP